jgi:phosphoglycerate dehydrogenase-like enzyme
VPNHGAGRTVVFLDDDPAVRLVRALVSTPLPVAVRDWLPGYFWPEPPPDPETRFAAIRRAIGWPDAATGVHLPDPANAPAEVRDSIEAVVFRRGVVDRALVDALPRLRVVQRFGTLAPEIDPATANAIQARRIAVCVFPRPSLASVAEHAIALLFAVRRRLHELDAATRSGRLARDDPPARGPVTYNWTGAPASGLVRASRVGILGLGEIGADLARLLGGLGAEVVYCNRRRLDAERERELRVEFRSLDALLAEVDALIVAATPPADGLPVIGTQQLARMRPTSILVNVARGSLIDETALADALERGVIAGAGLDVYAHEPLSPSSRLVRLSNAVLTPHVAGGTRTQLIDEVAAVAANVAAALRGEAPAHRISAGRGSA